MDIINILKTVGTKGWKLFIPALGGVIGWTVVIFWIPYGKSFSICSSNREKSPLCVVGNSLTWVHIGNSQFWNTIYNLVIEYRSIILIVAFTMTVMVCYELLVREVDSNYFLLAGDGAWSWISIFIMLACHTSIGWVVLSLLVPGIISACRVKKYSSGGKLFFLAYPSSLVMSLLYPVLTLMVLTPTLVNGDAGIEVH